MDVEWQALEEKHEQEIIAATKKAGDDKKALHETLKTLKISRKTELQQLKETQRPKQKIFKMELKRLEKELPQAEHDLKLLSNRGKLELVLADADLIGTLKERWIASEVAKRLDYPIFMAVSERGGKDTSGVRSVCLHSHQ